MPEDGARMNIIILGAGEIGLHMAEQLTSREHNICVIESDPAVATRVSEGLDVKVVVGNGSTAGVLEEAGVAECDVFFGLCSSDNTNIVAASLARPLGAKRSVARVHAGVHQEQWLFDFRSHFGVDYLFSPARLAAVELGKYIRNPDCLAVEEIARGRIELQQKRVTTRTPACGKKLRDLPLPQRVRVGSIERAGDVFIPGGDESLQAGDVVTLFGATASLAGAASIFRDAGETDDEKKVVIFGGGEYGLALAQILEGGKFRTRMFDTDPERCAALSRMLSKTTLLCADATSMTQLREEQVGDADFFVAATHADEDNVMTCLQAHDLGVRHCVTLIHRADYADAVTRAGSRLGILGAVSPRMATSRELVRFTVEGETTTLVTLRGGLEVDEFVVREGSPLAGRRIAEIGWPRGSLLVSCTRGSAATVPAANDILQAGDLLVALVAPGSRREFLKLVR